MQPTAEIASNQEFMGREPGKRIDGGFGNEDNHGSIIGMSWIPKSDGVVC